MSRSPIAKPPVNRLAAAKFRKTFVCQGNSDSACGDSHQSFISELSKSDDASVDPSDSRYWCKTVQIDVHAGSSPSDHQTTNASVIWIGDNGSYCIEDKYCMINGNRVDYVKDIQDTALDWDCSPPAAQLQQHSHLRHAVLCCQPELRLLPKL